MTQPFIHALADVQFAAIGANTRIWQFVVVPPGATVVGNPARVLNQASSKEAE